MWSKGLESGGHVTLLASCLLTFFEGGCFKLSECSEYIIQAAVQSFATCIH